MIGTAHLINLKTGEIIKNLAEHGSYIYDNYKKFGLDESQLSLYDPNDTEKFVSLAFRNGWARVRYGGGTLSLEHFNGSRQQIVNAIDGLINSLGISNPNSISLRIEDFNNHSKTYTIDYEEFLYQYANSNHLPLISSSILSLYEKTIK